MTRTLGITFGLSLGCLADPASAQTLIAQVQAGPGIYFGTDFDVVGDIDGDGWLDVAASRQLPTMAIELRSTQSGALLHTYVPGTLTMNGRVRRAGDVDGDGVGDYLTGTVSSGGFDNGHALIVSGATGQTLLDHKTALPAGSYASALTSAGDLTGDGVPDFLAATPNTYSWLGSNGIVVAHSGADGAILYQVLGPAYGSFGAAIDLVGDIDLDGALDFIVGAQNEPPGTVAGAAYLFRATTGAFLRKHTGTGLGAKLGENVAAAGDVDFDGAADYLACGSGPTFAYATLRSGMNGALLRTFSSPFNLNSSTSGGAEARGAGDVDGDGAADIVLETIGATNSPFQWNAAVHVYSALSGSLVHLIQGAPGTGGGRLRADVDVDGNGSTDFLFSRSGEGSVYAYSTGPAAVATFGTGCPGQSGKIPNLAIALLGSPGIPRLVLSNAIPGAPTFLLVGLAPGQTILPNNCAIYLASWTPWIHIPLVVPPSGSVLIQSPSFVPIAFGAQVIIGDPVFPPKVASSNGVQYTP